jgi:uncharacterized membrane protein YsdA (DUF1294 family)/cold shock CspA family protein
MTVENGKISSWNDLKGYGFITPESGGKRIFMHITDYSADHKRPVPGLAVTYELFMDLEGRLSATNVIPDKGHRKTTRAGVQKISALFISSVFFSIVAGLVLFDKLPLGILLFYLAVSTITFTLYAKDKSAAQTGRWRTPESTLHLFSLAGGWPGAAIAQSQLRHKSKKVSFKVIYCCTVLANCGILLWLLSPEGSSILKMILKTRTAG